MSDNLRDRKTVGEMVAEISKFPPDMPVMIGGICGPTLNLLDVTRLTAKIVSINLG